MLDSKGHICHLGTLSIFWGVFLPLRMHSGIAFSVGHLFTQSDAIASICRGKSVYKWFAGSNFTLIKGKQIQLNMQVA